MLRISLLQNTRTSALQLETGTGIQQDFQEPSSLTARMMLHRLLALQAQCHQLLAVCMLTLRHPKAACVGYLLPRLVHLRAGMRRPHCLFPRRRQDRT